MSAADSRLKKLRIQTGVVKRCGKEKLSYRKEANQQKEKLEKLKKEGKDDMEIKKMNEMYQESLMMIPDCHRKLEKAVKELKSLLEELESESKDEASNEDKEQPSELKEISEAKSALNESEDYLKAD